MWSNEALLVDIMMDVPLALAAAMVAARSSARGESDVYGVPWMCLMTLIVPRSRALGPVAGTCWKRTKLV
jgi:hypothetical protein